MVNNSTDCTPYANPLNPNPLLAKPYDGPVPMVVHVALIYPLGIYVASVLLIGYFMRRYGGYGWGLTAAVSVGVPLVFFLVFERWFLVPLPKGPIEDWLGL